MDLISKWQTRFLEYDADLLQVHSVEDIERAKREGLVGVILGFQNASPIGKDLDWLALCRQLGVSVIQVTYQERNLLGNGCFERRDDGLSNFGVNAVREMNRAGILIDLSHFGDRTTMETIELSEVPMACTHAKARS
jgi:membrane dipeptidase